MRRSYSLRRRLVAAMSLTFLLGLGGAMVYYYFEAYAVGAALDERTLQSQARELTAGMTASADGTIAFHLPPMLARLYQGAESTSFYTVFDPAGRGMLRSPNLTLDLPLVEAPATGGYSEMRFIDAEPGQVAALSVRINQGDTLVVGRAKPDEDALAFTLIEEELEGFFIVMVPFVLLSLLIIWQITQWSLRPVARASEEAMAIGPGNASGRIAVEGLPDEIRPLADAANGAVERLARAYAVEKRLTADAAHELRTPLAVLNLRLQQGRMTGVVDWPRLEHEIATLNKLVNQLLDLARKESAEHDASPVGTTLVNLSRIVREAAAMVLPLVEQAGRTIDIVEPTEAHLRGQPDDLRDMFRNLIENALHHGRGRIAVRVQPVHTPAHGFVVEIEDEGTAVIDDALFTRFRKGNPASSGTGLGLAIVRQVARNHGGEVAFVAGAVHTCVRVFLPTGQR
ncbi:HAMP domain-containing histidine kinase [Ancylobacter sp. A5.8]|uniref:sensor histidine kinase n=1 Tax=Ancylobacter gelatini TaxID=2919920 RepID=UPI001F4D9871|nr:HAMP domain-containing sensor histidine kinase [Ancylobacter gelatini]MCJ8144226.1 HAMP domain-containing histidine kinase [Ancylobacter gelatini]